MANLYQSKSAAIFKEVRDKVAKDPDYVINESNGEHRIDNPIHSVKNTRQTYNRFKGEVITEVQVQFDKEDPAWIPYSTLLAIESKYKTTV